MSIQRHLILANFFICIPLLLGTSTDIISIFLCDHSICNIYTTYPNILWLVPPIHYGTLYSLLMNITCYSRLLNIYRHLPTSVRLLHSSTVIYVRLHLHLPSSSSSGSIIGPLHLLLVFIDSRLRHRHLLRHHLQVLLLVLNCQRTGSYVTSELGWRRYF